MSVYHGLPVHRLVDVLAHVPLPPNCPLGGVSKKWRCVIAPKIADDETALYYFSHGIPCRLNPPASADVHDFCPDAFDFIYNKAWATFPAPKIAFRAGWAGPGTEMESEAHHTLISSFHDVVERPANATPSPEIVNSGAAVTGANDVPSADDILNLQLFHRPDASTHPQMPILAEKLVWPKYLHSGAVCDNATRVSQRGAITWWHLDDSGELVMQTALHLKGKETQHAAPLPMAGEVSGSIRSELYSLHERRPAGQAPPVATKLFIYGPPNSYDWFMHDDESDASRKIAALQIFNTPDDALPKDESLLPILTVCVLESGGRPLLSPSNIPHAVFTVNDCVMVEQRRVCNIFLDEVAYFIHKVKYWSGNPILYPYVDKELQDEPFVHDVVVPDLVRWFEDVVASIQNGGSTLFRSILLERLTASLYAILQHEAYFSLDANGRESLHKLFANSRSDGCPTLKSVLDRPRISHIFGVSSDARVSGKTAVVASPQFASLREQLQFHWDVKQHWPKPGCVFKAFAPQIVGEETAGGSSRSGESCVYFLPVVYIHSMPVYGVEKKSVGETATEFKHLASTGLRGKELSYLHTVKNLEVDTLLEELF